MLSIDEAIAHAREVANEQKRRSGICVQNNSECDKFSACLKCSKEHEQLAEWLEELKAFKKNKWTDIYIKRGYNKAIDDFIHECDKYCGFYSGKNKSITREYVLKIAEQLKE